MTQGERILAILADGEEHSHNEFYGFCVLHSRISELRKRGHVIACRREGDLYLYSLQRTASEAFGLDAVSWSESAQATGRRQPGTDERDARFTRVGSLSPQLSLESEAA